MSLLASLNYQFSRYKFKTENFNNKYAFYRHSKTLNFRKEITQKIDF